MYFFRIIIFLSVVFPFSFLNANAQSSNQEEVIANAPYSGKQDQAWETVQNEVIALKAKLDAQQALLNNLIAEKANLNGDALANKIEDVKKQHLKYEQLVVEYNKKNEQFLTRYPERGLKVKRLYKRVKLKSLETFEDEHTYRGKLNKLHKKVLAQYPKALAQSSDKSNAVSSDASKEKQKEVTDQIQLKK